MSSRTLGNLLIVGAFLILAVGIAIVIWGVTPRVFPECAPTDFHCDPTGFPETDEKIPLRMSILGVATVLSIALIIVVNAGRK